MDDIIREFLIESNEILDQLDQDLLQLEATPQDPALLDTIFRGIHTIKGTCGFMGFVKLEEVAHAAEQILCLLRDGTLLASNEIITALLCTQDAIREILSSIEKTEVEGMGSYDTLVAILHQFSPQANEQTIAPLPPAPVISAHLTNTLAVADLDSVVERVIPETEPALRLSPIARLRMWLRQRLSLFFKTKKAEPAPTSTASGSTEAIEAVSALPVLPMVEQIVEAPPVDAEPPPAPTRPPEPPVQKPESPAPSQERSPGSVAEQTIRVNVGLLDHLMNLVGELVLARNQLMQCAQTDSFDALLTTAQRINLITSDLQESVMKTRLQAVGTVWNKFPRVVRDVASACGKEVAIQMEGSETELDKSLLEAIKDPLIHLVRNAIDHGIETPEVRQAQQKSQTGTLSLRAYHEGGQVLLEIADDGAGLALDRIKDKAVSKGLITAEQAGLLHDREVMQLIFRPGFSTAQNVTNISGRGVGMDVVRTNIERVGGQIDVQTEAGNGTTFRIKMPLTLAIIPALIVHSASDRFAIPQVNLLELVRLENHMLHDHLETIQDTHVLRLRDDLVPLVSLDTLLGHASRPLFEREALYVVVVQADERRFGLVVDHIEDTEEIVVKPLNALLKTLGVYAGATILGDGEVALILDVLGLAERAGIHRLNEHIALNHVTTDTASAGDEQSFVLVKAGRHDRLAIPLERVDRLETIDHKTVEWVGTRPVLQYRNRVLPLLNIGETLDGISLSHPPQMWPIVVCRTDTSPVGLVVDAILDAVHEPVVIQPQDRHDGIVGAAILQADITEFIDIDQLVQQSGLPLYQAA